MTEDIGKRIDEMGPNITIEQAEEIARAIGWSPPEITVERAYEIVKKDQQERWGSFDFSNSTGEDNETV